LFQPNFHQYRLDFDEGYADSLVNNDEKSFIMLAADWVWVFCGQGADALHQPGA
jgi:hypothetical protein